nr:MAG TPA: hypothetical protein [Caudoviricetes sp.]
MFSYQPQIFENNQWQALSPWARPFTDGTALNDVLDAGCINLSLSSRYNPIKPFTPIRIIIAENGVEVDRIYRLVSSTKRTRRTFAPSVGAKYDWTINTIELTKAMERRFIGTLTSTKYLHTDYASAYQQVSENLNNGLATGYKKYIDITQHYYSPVIVGKAFTVYSNRYSINVTPNGTVTAGSIKRLNVVVKSPSGSVLMNEDLTANKNIRLDEIGTYTLTETLVITWTLVGDPGTMDETFKNELSFAAFSQIAPKTQPTITSVCQRLLSTGITRRGGFSAQEYVLDEDFAEEYKNVTAPEFSFTNCTLWDALSQVGGFIHAIPRLVPLSTTDDTHYKVTFDKLGGSEQAPTMPPMIYQDSTIDSNEWCGKIASPAQNLCNTTDEGGTITELGNDYITVRTEDGNIEINGDNVLIRTSLPIQQLIKLECGFIPDHNANFDGRTTPVGDITAYAYEDAEYSVLSSYWGTAYPYSKAWALRWRQGGTTIDGLTWRQKNVTSIGDAFQNTAIINIINAKTGLSLKSAEKNDGEWYRRLAFKVTYVPIATARVEAVKPVLTDGGETNNALVYNQGANVAETSFYGEKMRGAIARLGQDVEQRTYDIKTYSQMPKVGQILDGKYIATIDAEYDITRIRITVTLAKNFNQLSQFVGLNSNYRLYDISEKQSVERHIQYADKIFIGKTPTVGSNLTLLQNVPNVLINTINHSKTGDDEIKKAQLVRVLPFSAGNALQDRAVILPVVAFPFGTSICFNFSFYDNYGAGYQSSDDYENEKNKAAQRLVPYTDVYGEVSHIHFAMYNEGWTPNLAAQADGGYAKLYPQDNEFNWYSGDHSKALVDSYLVSYLLTDGALEINKDSREKIDVTYQVHYIAKSDDIVVGTGLADFCKLVTDTEPIVARAAVYVVWFDHTINGLNQYINDSLHLGSINTDVGYFERIGLLTDSQPYTIVDGVFRWDSRTCPRRGGAKAYAVCKWKGNGRYEMLFGQNVTLAYGDSTDALYFSPVPGEANDYVLMIAPANTNVYATNTGGNPVGKLRLASGVIPLDAEYSFIYSAQINRYSCLFGETFSYADKPTTITLKYVAMDRTLTLMADGLVLEEGESYDISGNQVISLLAVPAGTQEITAQYRVATRQAYDVVDGYVKTSDLVPKT